MDILNTDWLNRRISGSRVLTFIGCGVIAADACILYLTTTTAIDARAGKVPFLSILVWPLAFVAVPAGLIFGIALCVQALRGRTGPWQSVVGLLMLAFSVGSILDSDLAWSLGRTIADLLGYTAPHTRY